MHTSVHRWVESKVAEHDLAAKSTLEVGSYDVNGTVRPFFTGSYVGVDMREGPGVDKVAMASDLPFDDGTFEVVVCTEMLEHDRSFWLSIEEMARVLAPGGMLILTSRGIRFPLHEFPDDYWRFTPTAFAVIFDLGRLAPVEIVEDPDPQSPGVLGLARKPL